MIAIEIILFCCFIGCLYPTTAGAIAGPAPVGGERVALTTEENGTTCLKRLAGPKEAQPLVIATPSQLDEMTSSTMTRRPDVPTPSGYLSSWEELNRFIDQNELSFWVEEGKKFNGENRGISDHFVRLIRDYRDSVNNILLQKNLDQGQILKILYYNISSVSSGLIPVEWSHSSSELNYFLSDQLQLLRILLGKEIVLNYEMIRRDPRYHGPKGAEARNFVDTFQSIIAPLLHPRFGIRIVFQTCQLLYDLMLDQKYFQVSEYKLDVSLHKLLQEALLRTGTHPYVLLHFWAKEPRLLMDQDFPADGFWFRRLGVFKNLPQSKRRLKSLTENLQGSRLNDSDMFVWRKYNEFDPNFVLSFGSDAKYEEHLGPGDPRGTLLLEYLKTYLEQNFAGRFPRGFGTSTSDYFNYELKDTAPWSASLSGHASALSHLLLLAARDGRLLKFGLRISTSISADDQEFLDYVTSRNSDSISRIARNLNERRKPFGTRGLMHRFSEFFSRPFSLLISGPVDSQEVEPLLLESRRAGIADIEDASSNLYKTPALPKLGAVINEDTLPPDDDAPPKFQVQKLGTIYKQLAQEIESIYGWVMDINFGVGHVINYNRTWPEITSMINPDHLDEMIDRLTYDLALLVSIQTRMTDLDKDSQTGTASPIKTINTIFSQTNIVNYVQFTESLIENLEVIRHALKVHHQSRLVPSNSENIQVFNEMGRVSSRLRELPALLQNSLTRAQVAERMQHEIVMSQREKQAERKQDDRTQEGGARRRDKAQDEQIMNSVIEGTRAVLHRMEPGKFKMGEVGEPIDVTITKPFDIMTTPTTQIIWKKVAELANSRFGNKYNIDVDPSNFKGHTRPVEKVSYEDVQTWIEGLNELSQAGEPSLAEVIPDHKKGDLYRLLSEAEWEFVMSSRGQYFDNYHFGNQGPQLGDYAWFRGNSGRQTHPVGEKKPLVINGRELYDMHGNVWEWVHDWYGDELPGGTDPQGPNTGDSRVIRGGSWFNDEFHLRSYYRGNLRPGDRNDGVGFRLARTAK